MDIDRLARVHHDGAGDDRLGQRAGADGITSSNDGGQVLVDVDAGLDAIARRTGTGGGQRCERIGDSCIIDVTAHGDRDGAVGELAHQHLGDDHVGRCARTETEHTERHRCGGLDGRVVGNRCEIRGGLVDRHPSRHPTPRDPDGIANEEVAVTGGDVVQVEWGIGEVAEWSGRRLHGCAHSRVPTINCVSPPDSWVWRASPKPASASDARIASGAGR